ncbi:MAG: hypothetical protein UV19_C0008G0017 [Parcubacteria group bacterium GW2011_GWA2_42_28]|nr:MAG: hypothetical protein UV19_C0008G0017 [Parcubacteria group bacterium GW2011_GWA2_42_28]HIG97288.1 hypothetical protein [Candidatus Aenigmarchaeota archaeon]
MAYDFYRQLGTGVSSLTFGAALSIFVYAVASGIVSGLQAWLLFGSSFLLMLRFWWRYNELFVQHIPSNTFLHFLFDFAIAFFAILAVLFVGSIQTWALLGALAMISSAIRCGLSWASQKANRELKKTLIGAIGMMVIMGIMYVAAPVVSHLTLAAVIFVIVLIFVAYSSRRK